MVQILEFGEGCATQGRALANYTELKCLLIRPQTPNGVAYAKLHVTKPRLDLTIVFAFPEMDS